jgi:hypothetical protein
MPCEILPYQRRAADFRKGFKGKELEIQLDFGNALQYT